MSISTLQGMGNMKSEQQRDDINEPSFLAILTSADRISLTTNNNKYSNNNRTYYISFYFSEITQKFSGAHLATFFRPLATAYAHRHCAYAVSNKVPKVSIDGQSACPSIAPSTRALDYTQHESIRAQC